MTALFQLSDDVLCEIVSKWIELVDLVKFDSSLTSCIERNNFLDVLSSEAAFFFSGAVDVNMLHWLAKRDIKLTSLNLCSNCFSETFDLIHNVSCHKVTTIDCHYSLITEQFIQNINMCPNLQSLSLYDADDVDLAEAVHQIKQIF